MPEPKLGDFLLAERLISTEARSRRAEAPAWFVTLFSVAVMTSFLFFLLM
jgi:hypothetical protein